MWCWAEEEAPNLREGMSIRPWVWLLHNQLGVHGAGKEGTGQQVLDLWEAESPGLQCRLSGRTSVHCSGINSAFSPRARV